MDYRFFHKLHLGCTERVWYCKNDVHVQMKGSSLRVGAPCWYDAEGLVVHGCSCNCWYDAEGLVVHGCSCNCWYDAEGLVVHGCSCNCWYDAEGLVVHGCSCNCSHACSWLAAVRRLIPEALSKSRRKDRLSHSSTHTTFCVMFSLVEPTLPTARKM